MTFQDFLNVCSIYIDAFFDTIEYALRFFFEDAPVIFGLSLGWWFLLFGLSSLFISKLTGGDF